MATFLGDLAQIVANPFIALIFFAALIFDFINGFHDAANSIATVVGTKVLKPFQAVIWAAWWNFAAAWFFGVLIANTIARWVHSEFVTPEVILAGLIGAILWDLATWYKGLPTSSSHALLGGFAGAAIMHAGKFVGVLQTTKVVATVEFMVLAPFIGCALGFAFIKIVQFIFRRSTLERTDRLFRVVQLGSAAAYSLGHGTNDAQKTMGVIAALLYASIWKGQQAAFAAGTAAFPFWIVLVCHFAIALGTLAGGWRIVHTLAYKITDELRPHTGASAETAAAITLFASARMGVPVSTTHTITGAIVGVGMKDNNLSGVRWRKVSEIVTAWALTIPASALIAAGAYYLISRF